MIINGLLLLDMAPIKNMEPEKKKLHGVSYGLSEAGYDIRIKQQVVFSKSGGNNELWCTTSFKEENGYTNLLTCEKNNFALASAIEEFQMPNNLAGVVHDKSTWARQGLSVFNTVIEPGWNGFLTLELVYHGNKELIIPAGSGIAQVIFTQISSPATYSGKYQNQENNPVSSKFV